MTRDLLGGGIGHREAPRRRLTYLSCMRNPCCPGLMDIVTPDEEACRHYRLYVLHRLPGLACLDATDVTEAERSEAAIRGQFAIKRRPKNQRLLADPSASRGNKEEENPFAVRPEDIATSAATVPNAMPIAQGAATKFVAENKSPSTQCRDGQGSH